jgi:hypothetical protein
VVARLNDLLNFAFKQSAVCGLAAYAFRTEIALFQAHC